MTHDELQSAQDKSQCFVNNCINAISVAAAKLGMDPAVLAERCANGEIADLVEAVSSLPVAPVSTPDTQRVLIALKPFWKGD